MEFLPIPGAPGGGSPPCPYQSSRDTAGRLESDGWEEAPPLEYQAPGPGPAFHELTYSTQLNACSVLRIV